MHNDRNRRLRIPSRISLHVFGIVENPMLNGPRTFRRVIERVSCIGCVSGRKGKEGFHLLSIMGLSGVVLTLDLTDAHCGAVIGSEIRRFANFLYIFLLSSLRPSVSRMQRTEGSLRTEENVREKDGEVSLETGRLCIHSIHVHI